MYKKVRKLHELEYWEEIMFVYNSCKSCKITAKKLRIPYWYVRDMLEYFNVKVDNEKPSIPRNSETEEILEYMERNPNNKQVAEKYFRSHNYICNMRRESNARKQREKNYKYWLWQYNLTEKEVEDWYKKTRKEKTKH